MPFPGNYPLYTMDGVGGGGPTKNKSLVKGGRDRIREDRRATKHAYKNFTAH